MRNKIYVVAEWPDPYWQHVTQAIAEGYWYTSMIKAKAELKRAKAEWAEYTDSTTSVISPFMIYKLERH